MDGHSRWKIFYLVDPKTAEPSPPHLEDLWVRGLQSRHGLVDPALRRAILQATRTLSNEPWFGAPLTATRSSTYIPPRTGERSLASLVVPAHAIHFTASWREGTLEPDYRVSLDVPELQGRSLPAECACWLMADGFFSFNDPQG